MLVGGALIKSVRYADDQATLATSAEGRQRQMDQMDRVVREYGMRINKKKTKVMMISKYQTKDILINVNGNKLDQVKHFRYLGSVLTEEGRSAKEISIRTAQTKAAFTQRRDVLMSHNIELSLRK